MSAHTTQATPTPITQIMLSPITVLPISATTTAPVPLLPNPSSYVAAVATPPTSNTSYTFLPDLEVTLTPQGGFPISQIGASGWKNMNYAVWASWTIKQGLKIWVHMWQAKYEEDHQPNLAQIKALIGKITCPEMAAAVWVSAPVAAECLREKLPLPWHFLVSNIPQNLTDFLGWQVIISTLEITCFFLPFNPSLQTYLCTLENFALPCTAKANTIVADLVKSMILGNCEAVSFIERMKHPILELQYALSSTKKKMLWNVYYCCPPELSLSNFLTWANKICSTEFISENYGRGTAHTGEKQFSCFRWLCPFTELPGWFGPTTKSAESNEHDMIERDYGSPNRHAQQSPV
ncbi:hypothetical protein V8B97DRAFT_1919957 [Scleroderma yunnanense]